MRKIAFIAAFLFLTIFVSAQMALDTLIGEVSYVTSKNTYVKFESTDLIQPGDTLYYSKDARDVPALIIINKSSISCVCEPIMGIQLEKGTQVFVPNLRTPDFANKKNDTRPPGNGDQDSIITAEENIPSVDHKASARPRMKEAQRIDGRLTASGYTTYSGQGKLIDPRMRYTLSFKGAHLGNSGFSLDSYISFRHQINHWNEVSENPFDALKVYNLAVSYDTKHLEIAVGRKINHRISNIGAIDGLQIGYHWDRLTIGAVAGTRPDHADYGLNFNLPQAGVYAEHQFQGGNGTLRNTVGVFEQRSGTSTDRRYLYFQHSNSLINRMFVFASCEIDLFKNIQSQAQSDFRLTSLYVSARYKFSRQFNVFASYDNRRNVIYYETYKNALDQLIDQETRQGFRLRLMYRPFKYASTGISGTYRYQKNNLSPSKNVNAYFNYSRIPWLKASGSLSYTYLDTYYLNSHISGIRLNKDLMKGKMGLGMQYRYVIYHYNSTSSYLQHHITGLTLNWQLVKDLSLAIDYEVTIDKNDLYHRSYLKLIKRIR